MSTSKDYHHCSIYKQRICLLRKCLFVLKNKRYYFYFYADKHSEPLIMSSWSLSQRKQNSMEDFFISSCYLNNSLFFIPRLLSSCVVQAIKAGHKNDQRIWNCTLMSVIFVETFSNWKCKNKLVGYILKTSCFKTIKIMTLFRPILTISVSFLFFKVHEHHKDFFFFLR